MAAWSRVLLTNVVGRGEPSHSITDCAMKLLPSAVMVRAAAPFVAESGVIRVRTGDGLAAANPEPA